jgi:hypothetical protein
MLKPCMFVQVEVETPRLKITGMFKYIYHSDSNGQFGTTKNKNRSDIY